MTGIPDGKLIQNISLVGNKNITQTHKLSIKEMLQKLLNLILILIPASIYQLL